MRSLLAAIGIVALIGTGIAIETYKIDPNYVKTLPEQEIPLP